jgi:hypothetical protein
MSGRAQRKAAAQEAARRRQWTLIGSAIGVVLLVALVAFLILRPRDAGPPVLAADPLPATIPTQGRVMGAEDATVTVVEWGDYT